MRLVPIESAKEGNYLAKTIYDNTGRILLREGAMLTSNIIKRIQSLGIYTVYIHDKYSTNVIEDVIEPQIRQKAVQNIKATFDFLQRRSQASLNDPSKQKMAAKEKEEYVKSITDIAEDIMNEVLSRKKILVNLVDIKSMDNYTYQHSVNVSVLSLILGIKLKLSKYELFTLCVGALLHLAFHGAEVQLLLQLLIHQVPSLNNQIPLVCAALQ